MCRHTAKSGSRGMLLFEVNDNGPFPPSTTWYVLRRSTGKITKHYGDEHAARSHYNVLHKKVKHGTT